MKFQQAPSFHGGDEVAASIVLGQQTDLDQWMAHANRDAGTSDGRDSLLTVDQLADWLTLMGGPDLVGDEIILGDENVTLEMMKLDREHVLLAARFEEIFDSAEPIVVLDDEDLAAIERSRVTEEAFALLDALKAEMQAEMDATNDMVVVLTEADQGFPKLTNEEFDSMFGDDPAAERRRITQEKLTAHFKRTGCQGETHAPLTDVS